MTRRPFRDGTALLIWKEILLLRQEEGLTPDRVGRLAPTFLNLPAIRSAWEGSSQAAGEIGCILLMLWLEALSGPYSVFPRVAFGVHPVPAARQSNLEARRKYIAAERHCGIDDARYHEDRAIEALIRSLLETPDSTPTSLQSLAPPTEPIAELVTGDGQRLLLDIPTFDQPPTPTSNVLVVNRELTYGYDARRQLVLDGEALTLRALEDGICRTGVYVRYPKLRLRRLVIVIESGCELEHFGKLGEYFLIDFHLQRELREGEQHSLAYHFEIDGEGELNTAQGVTDRHDLEQLTVNVVFDPGELPAQCWWFDQLPHNAVPDRPRPTRMLAVTTANPVASRLFGPQPASPFYCGIAWRW